MYKIYYFINYLLPSSVFVPHWWWMHTFEHIIHITLCVNIRYEGSYCDWQQQHNYLLQSVVLHSRRPQVNALAAISLLLLLAGQLFDVATMAESAHGACEPLLQGVSRALGSWGVAMEGSEWSLGLQRCHRVCLPIWTTDCVVLCGTRVWKEKNDEQAHDNITFIWVLTSHATRWPKKNVLI